MLKNDVEEYIWKTEKFYNFPLMFDTSHGGRSHYTWLWVSQITNMAPLLHLPGMVDIRTPAPWR